MKDITVDDLITIAEHLENASYELKKTHMGFVLSDITVSIVTDEQSILKLDRELYNITGHEKEHTASDEIIVNILGFKFDIHSES